MIRKEFIHRGIRSIEEQHGSENPGKGKEEAIEQRKNWCSLEKKNRQIEERKTNRCRERSQ